MIKWACLLSLCLVLHYSCLEVVICLFVCLLLSFKVLDFINFQGEDGDPGIPGAVGPKGVRGRRVRMINLLTL